MKAVRGGLIVAVAALEAVRVSDVHADEKVRFEILEQPVDTALLKFSQQARIPALFPRDTFVGVDARMLVGEYSVEEGLEILLRDTGVEASVDEHGQLVIRTTQKKDEIIARSENNRGVGMAEESTKSRKLRAAMAALIAGGSAGAAIQPVAAQPQLEATDVDAIVVTGSRIARRDYSSESPILTVGQDVFQNTPAVTIEATLSQMPQFVGAHSGVVAFPHKNGQANLNLRGLGPNRVLVLLDGRRMQPTSPDGAVDVNSLPLNLIGSIETITGGASAVYGSDAIAGVVNFRLANDIYDGAKVTYKTGITGEGDGRTNQFSFGYGGRFADDRGSAVVSVGYSDRDMIRRWDRAFFPRNFERDAGGLPVMYALPFIPQGTVTLAANPPSQAAVDAVFTQYGAAPGVAQRLDRFGFNADGTLFTATPVTRPVTNYRGEQDRFSQVYRNQVVRDLGGNTALQMGFEMVSLFGKVGYDLSDNLELYGQVYQTDYEVFRAVSNLSMGTTGTVVTSPVTNPFIPPDFATLLASRANPNAAFPIQKTLTQLGDSDDTDVYGVTQVLAGIGGSLQGRDWTWDAHVSYGKNEYSQDQFGASLSRIQTLLGAPDGGASLCEGGYNPFGPHAVSESCITYLRQQGWIATWLEQTMLEGTIQGSVFELPAGEVGFAVGVTYRDNIYSNERSAANNSGDLLGYGLFDSAVPASGSLTVAEVFGEVLVPVAEKVDVGLAYRFSDYDISGGLDTYRATLSWSPVDPVTVRGGYSRAARAPSLQEFFSGVSSGSFTVGQPTTNPMNGDPCDIRSAARNGPDAAAVRQLCIAQGVDGVDGFFHEPPTMVTLNQGNRDILPELADTSTVGLVWRSSSTNLTGSIDYFDIRIDGAIGALPTNITLSRCFNYDGSNPTYSPDNYYCTLIVRAPTAQVEQPLLNLASLHTAGVDMQLDWQAGNFSLNFTGTYTDKLVVAPLEETPGLNYAGTTSNGSATPSSVPQWKTVSTLRYGWSQASVGLRWRHLSSVEDALSLTVPTSTVPGLPTYNYFDLMGSWNTNGSLSFRFGVTNLTDKQPPILGGSAGFTDMMTYDVLGRSYYVDMSLSF